MRYRTAFTLIELIVVMIIVGILAAIAAPRFYSASDDAEATAILANVSAMHSAVDLYLADNGELPKDVFRGVFPSELEGYLSPTIFENYGPDKSQYDWNGVGSGTDIGLTLVFPSGNVAKTDLYQRIEELGDDGSDSAGWITARGPRIVFEYSPK